MRLLLMHKFIYSFGIRSTPLYLSIAFATFLSGCEVTVYEKDKSLSDTQSSDTVVDSVSSSPDAASSPAESTTPVVSASGVASQFAVTPSSLSVSAGGTLSLAFQAQDSGNSVVTDYTGVLTVTSSDSAAVLPAPQTLTISDAGVVSISGIELRTAGTHTLTISDGTLSRTVSGIVVSPASLASLTFAQQPAGSSIAAGSSFSTQPTVLAKDVYNNSISGLSLTLQAYTSSDCATTAGAGSLANATASTASGTGIASFSGLNYTKAGETLYLKAISGLVTACSTGTISVVAAAPSSVVFTQQPAATNVAASAAFTTQPTVTVTDAYNNAVASGSVSLAAYSNSDCSSAAGGTLANGSATSNASGLATFSGTSYSQTASSLYFKATAGSAESACSTGSVSVGAGALSSLVFTTQPTGTNIVAGANFTTQPVVTATDANSNPISGVSVTLSIYSNDTCTSAAAGTFNGASISTSESGIATFTSANFNKAGTYYIKATASSVDSACSTSAITIIAGTATTIAYTQQPTGTINVATAFTQQPIVSVSDTHGNAVSGATVQLAPFTAAGCTGGAAGILLNNAAVTNASGLATFTNVNYSAHQTIYIRAKSGDLSVCSSGSVVINGGIVLAQGSPGTYTCAIKSGAASCWGHNERGNLGDNTGTNRSTATAVTNLTSGVTQIVAGGDADHTVPYDSACAVHNGAAKCWGYNAYGTIGDGSSTDRLTAVNVSGLASGVTQIASAHHATCALQSGSLKCWGSNTMGQLGLGDTSNRTTPTSVTSLTGEISQLAMGGSYNVSATHACAISDGVVYCWGDGGYGQLGTGDSLDRLTPVRVSGLIANQLQVTAGAIHTCALDTEGAIRCWGSEVSGRVGNGVTTSTLRLAPVQVTSLPGTASQVVAGANHTCALVSGSIYCWGSNVNGGLGNGNSTAVAVPVQVTALGGTPTLLSAGKEHTCAKVGALLKCWGRGTSGQLGNRASTNRTTPVLVSGY